MEISTCTHQGVGSENEDGVFTSAKFIAVLDGLSTPMGLSSACTHGTPWYVRNLGAQLLVATAEPSNLSAALAISIENVNKMHQETCDTSRVADMPSSTVTMVRITDDEIEYLVLSDTTLVFDTVDGISVVTDQSVESVALKERAAVFQEPTGTARHRELVSELVRAQRAVRNRPAGYWVASTLPEAAEHAVTGSIRRSNVHSVALLTDGAARLVDPFGLMTWRAALDVVSGKGPAELIRRTRAVEASDPHGARWPRYKSQDDATIAYCRLVPTIDHDPA